MILDKKVFGDFLAEKRTELGISQIALARELGYSSPQYVSNWERALCGPPLDKLFDLSRILKIDPSIFMKMILDDTQKYLSKELRLSGKKASAAGRRK